MRRALFSAASALAAALVLGACSGSTPTSSSESLAKTAAYPVFDDGDGDGVNDYLERGRHAGNGHAFTDADGDGVCDYAQDGGPAWHGPGFVDDDGNGICDYWQTGSARHNRHNGLYYEDRNGDGINDYQERFRHSGDGHPFVDADGDGICDYAQDGGPAWHGPGYVDEDGDGFHDGWGPGERGPHHGRGRGGPAKATFPTAAR